MYVFISFLKLMNIFLIVLGANYLNSFFSNVYKNDLSNIVIPIFYSIVFICILILGIASDKLLLDMVYKKKIKIYGKYFKNLNQINKDYFTKMDAKFYFTFEYILDLICKYK